MVINFKFFRANNFFKLNIIKKFAYEMLIKLFALKNFKINNYQNFDYKRRIQCFPTLYNFKML